MEIFLLSIAILMESSLSFLLMEAVSRCSAQTAHISSPYMIPLFCEKVKPIIVLF
jgi:hypothetical protein